ncbi:hypothetical protein FKM82_000197 [Ascaphus truei]
MRQRVGVTPLRSDSSAQSLTGTCSLRQLSDVSPPWRSSINLLRVNLCSGQDTSQNGSRGFTHSSGMCCMNHRSQHFSQQ